MSFPDDVLHPVHRGECRASQDGAEDDGVGCDATPASAEEPDGIDDPEQDQLLYQHPEHHPRRGRSDGGESLPPRQLLVRATANLIRFCVLGS